MNLQLMAGRPWRGGLFLVSVILVCLFLLFSTVIHSPVPFRSTMYSVYRDWQRVYYEYKTRDWLVLEGRHFYVKYLHEDRNVARLVLNTAERYYQPVSRDFGFAPENKVLIAIYPTREDLSRSFGWSADESAMGVYWAGVIRILSPNDWLTAENRNEFEAAFESGGPMAHEYTHLVIDYLTGGNYPRWLTEGVAQYEERKLTGFAFEQPKNTSAKELLSLEYIDQVFDSPASQNLAYWEAREAVDFLVFQIGPDGVKEILSELKKGKNINQSLELVYGAGLEQFESEFFAWLGAKMEMAAEAA